MFPITNFDDIAFSKFQEIYFQTILMFLRLVCYHSTLYKQNHHVNKLSDHRADSIAYGINKSIIWKREIFYINFFMSP